MQYPQEFTEAAVNEVETYRHEIDIKITSCELLKRYSTFIIVAFAKAAIKSRMEMSRIDPAAQSFVADFLIEVQNRKEKCRKVIHVVNNWLRRHVPERRRYAYVTLADCEAEIVKSDYHNLLIAYGKLPIENKDPAIKREAESILIDEGERTTDAKSYADASAQWYELGKLRIRADFLEVQRGKQKWTLTLNQGKALEFVHKTHRANSSIHQRQVLRHIESPSARLRETFRSKKGLYAALFAKGEEKGHIRLNA